jgi:hypothetical protein
MTIVKECRVNDYVNQTQLKTRSDTSIQTKFNKKVSEYFDHIYSYPPKIQIKWDRIDELNDDLFIGSNYGVLEHSIPFTDYIDDWFFAETTEEAISDKYTLKKYTDGFLDKLNSSDFFLNKTKKIQATLANIPIFLVLNGQGEIVLSKPANVLAPNSFNSYLSEKIYDSCGAFDAAVEKKGSLGLFFMDYSDAENYLKEVARADFEGTQTVGLSIYCVNLGSAYKITREYHPGVDFRFVPNMQELKGLLVNKIGKSDMIVEDEQQQLRFRRRTVNLFPYLKKLGNYLSPSSSFLQRNEYFKGVPIYIVQLNDKPRNFFAEQYFNAVGYLDTFYNGCIQCLDSTIGFGHNWILQGSFQDTAQADNSENYVFFEKEQALRFSKKHGRNVSRYAGGRSSNLEFAVRKPKIFIYNLEDFLEDWEDNLLQEISGTKEGKQNFFKRNAIKFVSPGFTSDTTQILNKQDSNFVKTITQTLGVKARILKRTVGIFFSIN